MDDTDRVGQRIATTRKSLDLTQQQLADKARVSKSMLSKVESGHAAASNAWLGAVARALGVDVGYLSGQPYNGTPDNAEIHRTIPGIRRALVQWDLVEPTLDSPRLMLDEIAWDVHVLQRWRHETAYYRIGQALPAILEQLIILTKLADGPERNRAFKLLTSAYRAANTMAHKLGYTDLSLTALERMHWAAAESHDPLLVAIVDYIRAGALTRLGEHDGATRLLTRAIGSIEPLAAKDETARAVLGCLHMKLISAYGASANSDMANTHLAIAERIAAETGPDRQVYDTVFGPVNVQLHALSARVDMAQPGQALEVARRTHLPPETVKERATYFYTDLARAHLLNGDSDNAVEALYEARSVAPAHFANSSVVRGTIYSLAAQQRRANHGLRSLAHSIGIRD